MTAPQTPADWANLGGRVLPLGPDKRPRGPWKELSSATPAECLARLGDAPKVGILTGELFDVLDIDGPECWEDLTSRGINLPHAYGRARTPSGGWHVFVPVLRGNGTDLLGTERPHGNLDWRGSGGYVAVVPSPGYTWEQPLDLNDPYVDVSEWAATVAMLKRAHGAADQSPASRPRGSTNRSPWVEAKLRARVADVAQAPEGSRNHTLNTSALQLGHYVATGYLDRADVEQQLTEAARTCGLGPAETRATIRSGIEAGLRQPMEPPRQDKGVESLAAWKSRTQDVADPSMAEDSEEAEDARLLATLKNGAWLEAQIFPPVSWAVPGLIPEGFGLFTGPPKTGKSWTALGLALAVANGDKAFGKIPVGAPRPVLLLALEDGDRRLQDRGHKLHPGPLPAMLDYQNTTVASDVVKLIRAWLKVYGDRQPLVILDTLGKVMSPARPGEGAYSRDYRVGSELKALTDKHPGSCLMVVHHVRKAIGDDWMDSTSGTNGLNGAADWTLNLSRPRNRNGGVLRVTGRDVPEGEYAVTLADGRWTLDGDDLTQAAQRITEAEQTANLGDRATELFEYVARQSTPVTAKQVADALNVPDARRYLARMAESGRLVKTGRGMYTTPDRRVPSVPTVPTQAGRAPAMGQTGQMGHPSDEASCPECGEPMGSPGLLRRCRPKHGTAAPETPTKRSNPMDFDDPDTWTDEDYDLSETPPEEWPDWALAQLPDPEDGAAR